MAESSHQIIVVRSAPGTPEATGALRLATSLCADGRAVVVFLIQDAVLGALRSSDLASAHQLRALVEDGVRCHYLADDLALRGYGPADVAPGCFAGDDDALVDTLLADETRVLGAF